MGGGAGARLSARLARLRSAIDKTMPASIPSDFGFLLQHDVQLMQFGTQER